MTCKHQDTGFSSEKSRKIVCLPRLLLGHNKATAWLYAGAVQTLAQQELHQVLHTGNRHSKHSTCQQTTNLPIPYSVPVCEVIKCAPQSKLSVQDGGHVATGTG